MSSISSVGKDDFQTEVLEAQLPVLVDFWASWCGPCQMFAPVVEALAEAHTDKLKVVKVNVDNEPELSDTFDVMTIPTLALIRNGETLDTMVGALPLPMVEDWLKQHGAL